MKISAINWSVINKSMAIGSFVLGAFFRADGHNSDPIPFWVSLIIFPASFSVVAMVLSLIERETLAGVWTKNPFRWRQSRIGFYYFGSLLNLLYGSSALLISIFRANGSVRAAMPILFMGLGGFLAVKLVSRINSKRRLGTL